ncbi:hypothetical protein [Portibacter marinus]|uniref:hypothetical protein n=1 Tax=Portibacter marinus TaxID=2898660 RepID=UPI001F1963C3|nr:hypothetical protein [Portibacter marinus]
MRTLIKYAFLVLLIILGYNYFFGSENEQEQAERIVEKVKDLGSDIKSLVVAEKERYDEGKYDETIDKFTELINSLKDRLSNIDLEKLQDQKKELEKSMEQLKEQKGSDNEAEKRKIENEMQDLLEELKKSLEGLSDQQ